jgi:hypothetical protein
VPDMGAGVNVIDGRRDVKSLRHVLGRRLSAFDRRPAKMLRVEQGFSPALRVSKEQGFSP